MVNSQRHYRARDVQQSNREQKAREALLPNFPPTTPVTWFGDDVGVVTGHTSVARVLTTTGRDYDPRELKIVPPDEQTR